MSFAKAVEFWGVNSVYLFTFLLYWVHLVEIVFVHEKQILFLLLF